MKYLDQNGLQTLVEQIKQSFATQDYVNQQIQTAVGDIETALQNINNQLANL